MASEMTAGERLIEQGRLDTARSLVLRLMKRRFRTVPPGVRKQIEATVDVSKLEQCAERILDAKSIAEIVEDL